MVSRLKEINSVVEYLIDEPIDLVDPPRPDIATELLQMLGLSNSREWLANYSVHQIQNPKRNLSIRVHPVMQIVAAL